jgi:uncharacterized protein YjbJ (UPF0337 family)
MTNQETHGKVKKLKGRAKEAAGIVSGNKELERAGSRLRAEGEAQESLSKARRRVSGAIEAIADAVKA